MSENRSPRVNKALMEKFKGQTVRLIAKLKSFRDDVAIVEASDGGEVEVKVLKDFQGDSLYVEIIGQVADERTIKMKGFIPLGDSVDMKLADDVVQVWHDPKFVSVF
ncbi:replication factor A protein 3 [Trametes coccinea BRFM310]|uniref:Replication factor A protein 3 n=1 Tax=Trametes coccinea (strain BRFM310) TaxID=1353009 RepID=A0A1Y2IJW5_TRAC3|nr:replication factor A protein 3 [Trametes coccinea BRFM310]